MWDKQEEAKINVLLVSSTFLAHFLTCGFSTSIGVFYIEFLEEFQHSSGITAWVGSINFSVMCLVGPVASWISKRYGCHICVGLGGIVSVIGVLFTTFSQSIIMLFVVFGFVAGCGFGLVYSSCIIVINLNISKLRSLYTGISVCGIVLGTSLHPLISTLLINMYGWRGALLIIAGMMMHVCLAGELIWIAQCMINERKRKAKVIVDYSKACDIQLDKCEKVAFTQQENINKFGEIYHVSDDYLNEQSIPLKGKKDEKFTNFETKHHEKMNLDNKLTQTKSKNAYDCNSKCDITNSQLIIIKDGKIMSNSNHHFTSEEEISSPMWKIPMFWALHINTIFYCFGQSVVFTHITAFAKVSGQTYLQASSYISLIGISGLFGKILLGYFAQHPKIDTTILFSISYFLSGVCTICFSLWLNYAYMSGCMVVFGFFASAYGPVLTEIIIQSLSHKYFASAFGYIMATSAIGTLFGAPCAGWLYDYTSQYCNSLYLGGVTFMISIIPIIICRYVDKCKGVKCCRGDS